MVSAEEPFAVGQNAVKQAVRTRRFARETDEVRVAVAAVERARMGVAEYSDAVYVAEFEQLGGLRGPACFADEERMREASVE